jgi:hypothetical protein
LGFGDDHGDVWFAFRARADLDGAFAALRDVPVMDYTETVRGFIPPEQWAVKVADEKDVLDTVATAAAVVAGRCEADELVAYIPSSVPGMDEVIGFGFDHGTVVVGLGDRDVFGAALTAFDEVEKHDMSHSARLNRHLIDYARMLDEGAAPRAQVFANLFVIAAMSGATPALDELLLPERRRTKLRRLLRDRFFEALLLLEAAREEPSENLAAWVERHVDPDADEGLSAVLPGACAEAVRSFAKAAKVSPRGREALDAATSGASATRSGRSWTRPRRRTPATPSPR